MSNPIDNLKTGIKVMFSNFTDAQRAEIKTFIDGIKETPAPSSVQMTEEETEDGKKISFEGELKEGVVINEVTEAGAMPLPAGEYKTKTGISFTIGEGGKVAAVKPVEAAPANEMPKMAEIVQQMETKFSAYKSEVESKAKAENESLKKEIEALKGSVKFALTTIDKMLEAPVNTVNFEAVRTAEVVKFNSKLSETEYLKLSNKDKEAHNRLYGRP